MTPFPPEPPFREVGAGMSGDSTWVGQESLSGVGSFSGRPVGAVAADGRGNGLSEACSPEESLAGLVGSIIDRLRSLPSPLQDSWKQDPRKVGVFPLPLPRGEESLGCKLKQEWEEGIIRTLNWLSTGSFAVREGCPSSAQRDLWKQIRLSLDLVDEWFSYKLESFNVESFWNQKHINSYGEEVHVARSLRWENIADALPKAECAGIVPAELVCQGGMKDFITSPHLWLKPQEDRVWMRPPRVMIPSNGWDEVVSGLLGRNICGVLPLSQVFQVENTPVLGGLFGVPKNETNSEGVEIYRLIMDLRAINQNFVGLGGDLSTLPLLSQMFQLEMQPHEELIISSEDVRAMFYIIGLPEVWAPYLSFGRVVPSRFNPPGVREPCVLYSKVLPMGFVNSVALAQHLHRQIVGSALSGQISSNCEIRRDREFPQARKFYRVYLDNFDELSVGAKQVLESEEESLVSLLQSQYKKLQVPRNEKKAVFKQFSGEMQGAWLNGHKGIAYAKCDKASKYLRGVLEVLRQGRASQKQLQMLAGGLVYIFSFRRTLMSCLNEIWSFIVAFGNDKRSRPLPSKVQSELIAAFFLASVSYMDFRQACDETVTASDASESGGGLVCSSGLTKFGLGASQGLVRGPSLPEEPPAALLAISCFDGIGALRVSLDVLDVPVSGYVAIEKDPAAQRVVESAFPSCERVDDICSVSESVVRKWAAKFPTCKAVLVAGGPPCQGVSGLNADKKGAILDPRSSLVREFKRVVDLVRSVFTWCPVFTLMESVSSMNSEDRSHYSKTIGLLPYEVDSKYLSLCRRPRLWWFDWTIKSRPGVSIIPPKFGTLSDFGSIFLEHSVNPEDWLRSGWSPANPEGRFATFTTSQPKSQPGHKPAGLGTCSELDLQKWKEDRFRFPSYIYKFNNGVIHRKKGWRLLTIEEKEAIMGFPMGFTIHSSTKSVRKSQPNLADDIRMTLIGNSWHV